jgi:hypothetical protein
MVANDFLADQAGSRSCWLHHRSTLAGEIEMTAQFFGAVADVADHDPR